MKHFDKEHYAKLLNFSLKITGSRNEDLVQETICRALASGSFVQQGAEYDTYLYTIMKNTWINHIKKDKVFDRICHFDGCDNSDHILNENLLNKRSDIAQDIVLELTIRKLLKKFEPKTIDMLWLNLQGYTPKEVSILLGIKHRDIKTRMFRARRYLNNVIKNDYVNVSKICSKKSTSKYKVVTYKYNRDNSLHISEEEKSSNVMQKDAHVQSIAQQRFIEAQ